MPPGPFDIPLKAKPSVLFLFSFSCACINFYIGKTYSGINSGSGHHIGFVETLFIAALVVGCFIDATVSKSCGTLVPSAMLPG